LVEELEQVRRNLLGEISDVRSARTTAKQKAVRRLNKRLAGKLRISIVPDGLRQPLRQFLQRLPGVGERKTEWVDKAEELTVLGLVAAIREGRDALLGKPWGLTSGVAETLVRMTAAQVYGLEAIDLEDLVGLELNVSHTSDRYRALNRLSTGQQCTAILHLLLLDNPDPLVMDQPEDNLDNAFIAERIVQELRTAKTERQFLFATHNANIPVFGDAEWIGVCSASDDRAEMPINEQGSIDIPAIRDRVANILEGGKEAFMQRKEKYGFDY
ncbi:MAG: ATPase, partial [Albidovulum sp.]|nr:ATPase [Albidovulum sp.]